MEYKIYDRINDAAKSVRIAVFVNEQNFENEFDSTDDIAKHIVLYDDNKPIAVCRFFFYENRSCYFIGRIAVLKDYRGRKLGLSLLKIAEKSISELGGKKVMLTAQLRVTKFYEKCGYATIGDVFFEEYCPHIMMYKTL